MYNNQWLSVMIFKTFQSSRDVCHHHYHHQFLNRKGRWGTTDDFATSFLHFSLFSLPLWDLPNSRPVHSLMLSSHLYVGMPESGNQQSELHPFTRACWCWSLQGCQSGIIWPVWSGDCSRHHHDGRCWGTGQDSDGKWRNTSLLHCSEYPFDVALL